MVRVIPKVKVSAIISNEKILEDTVNALIEVAVDRHQIDLQGTPEQLTKVYGNPYVDPHIIQHNPNAPKHEPFLMDDFGWVLGLSFAIPFIIGVVIGIFFIGNLFSVKDNFLYGALGGLVGGGIGLILSAMIRKYRAKEHAEQEHKGGFVIWVQVDSEAQQTEVVSILNKFNAQEIEIQ